MYRRMIVLVVLATLFIMSNAMATEKNQDYQLFEKIFSTWTDSFNHEDLAGSCRLFSQNMVANYQGTPPKSFTSICNGFKKMFQEPRNYQYHFKLHQVYRSNKLAAVRVTWYLRVSEQNKLISESQDEGLDVFQQDNRGHWKIINYLGYPEKN